MGRKNTCLLVSSWMLHSYEVKSKGKKSLSRVRLFATPWTVAYQAPPPMGFSRQGYWSGLPFPSPGTCLILKEAEQRNSAWAKRYNHTSQYHFRASLLRSPRCRGRYTGSHPSRSVHANGAFWWTSVHRGTDSIHFNFISCKLLVMPDIQKLLQALLPALRCLS